MPLDAEETAENLEETDALNEAAEDIGANVESVTLFNGMVNANKFMINIIG